MRITISNTTSALNIGMDQEAATAILRGSPRLLVRFDAPNNCLVLSGSFNEGKRAYLNHEVWYVNIIGGVRGHSRHGKIVFKGEDIVPLDGAFVLNLPKTLPPLIAQTPNTTLTKPPKPRTGANMVMTIGDMTVCFNVPQQAALKLAFSLSAKGYMTEGAE